MISGAQFQFPEPEGSWGHEHDEYMREHHDWNWTTLADYQSRPDEHDSETDYWIKGAKRYAWQGLREPQPWEAERAINPYGKSHGLQSQQENTRAVDQEVERSNTVERKVRELADMEQNLRDPGASEQWEFAAKRWDEKTRQTAEDFAREDRPDRVGQAWHVRNIMQNQWGKNILKPQRPGDLPHQRGPMEA